LGRPSGSTSGGRLRLAAAGIAAAAIATLLGAPPAHAQRDAPRDGRDDPTPLAAADWTRAHAAHLLERAGFGGTPAEIDALAALGPVAAVRTLVRYPAQPAPNLPIFDASGVFPSDDFVPPPPGAARPHFVRAFFRGEALGASVERRTGPGWAQPIADQLLFFVVADAIESARAAAWQGERMLLTTRPLEEKLALFWHGHFATSNQKVRDHRKMLAQWDLFRARGNARLRDLVLGVARDPAMLLYLDGVENVRGAPNENFARELLELFTLGVGQYTQDDVSEAARAFTGWGLDGNAFHRAWWRHDKGRKTFLGRTARLDGTDVIDRILEEPACARFIAAKLYTFFVRPDPSPALIESHARTFRESGHDIAVLLEAMLLSRDFYSDATRGAHVKGPVELVVSTYRKMGLETMPGIPGFTPTTQSLGQRLYAPPNVAGWPGDRVWITPATLVLRQNFARYVLFPQERPLPRRRPIELVADIVGRDAFEQMEAMARRGDFSGAPTMPERASGLARVGAVGEGGAVDLARALYNGARKALRETRLDVPLPAELSVSAWVRSAGAHDAETAVDALASRFLSVPMRTSDRAALIAQLERSLAGRALFSDDADEADDAEERDGVKKGVDVADEDGMERMLREVLHLVLSLPEYQLS
jgi:hypothetical protein